MTDIGGYVGRMLRVDLTNMQIREEDLDSSILRKFIGGTGIGAKFLYDEVPPGVGWSHPQNRLIFASGPLGATRIGGSGTFSVVTKGPLTNGATSVQANGFFGAFLKLSGFDGIILQGASKKWVYLVVDRGVAELREADHLVGRDTFQTEDLVKKELGKAERQTSVVSIGPAGENLVKFAGIFADKGHSASHNGPGAVMGSKRLKAIAVTRGKTPVVVRDAQKLSVVAEELLRNAKNYSLFRWGNLPDLVAADVEGYLPVRNYTTNTWVIGKEERDKFEPEYILEHFSPTPNPCWACQHHHCHRMTINEGPYSGLRVEEPEYEQLASWSANIGQTDMAAAFMLSHETDRLGMENNEVGWTISWVMECFEKGIITERQTNGIKMNWGSVEATKKMLNMIATREGFGDVLAEGVMRASRRVGEEASELAIYTKKGNTPRAHDHRTRWFEMFDTCVSDTGTIEGHLAQLIKYNPSYAQFRQLGDPIGISTETAKTRGIMPFEDSLGVCRFNTHMNLLLESEALSAVTGWDFESSEAMTCGFRIANLLRAFNVRHGHTPDLEYPSVRYGSTPVDGPAKDKSITPYWEQMLDNYYDLMGWDRASGRPYPATLDKLGLENVARDLW